MAVVPTAKSSANVLMVEAAENRQPDDASIILDWPSRWGVLGQGEVGPEIVVVGDVAFEDSSKMLLSERDQMVGALATD